MIRRMLSPMAAAVIALVGCGGPAPASGAHWRRIGSLDGSHIQFVEIEAGSAKDGRVYRNAVGQLCPAKSCFQIGFFLPGDRVPPSGSRRGFFSVGGWAGYEPAAIYSAGGEEFTKWNCEKAGDADAPSSALCGPGAAEEYRAILQLASREAWTKACGLSATKNLAFLEKYLTDLSETKRDNLRAAYDHMYQESLSGPDDPSNCRRLAPSIEENGRRAVATLKDLQSARARTNAKG